MCQTLSLILDAKHVHEGGIKAHFTDRDTEVEINRWRNLPVASLCWMLTKDKLRKDCRNRPQNNRLCAKA